MRRARPPSEAQAADTDRGRRVGGGALARRWGVGCPARVLVGGRGVPPPHLRGASEPPRHQTSPGLSVRLFLPAHAVSPPPVVALPSHQAPSPPGCPSRRSKMVGSSSATASRQAASHRETSNDHDAVEGASCPGVPGLTRSRPLAGSERSGPPVVMAEDTYIHVNELQKSGINAADITKLVEAGITTTGMVIKQASRRGTGEEGGEMGPARRGTDLRDGSRPFRAANQGPTGHQGLQRGQGEDSYEAGKRDRRPRGRRRPPRPCSGWSPPNLTWTPL